MEYNRYKPKYRLTFVPCNYQHRKMVILICKRFMTRVSSGRYSNIVYNSIRPLVPPVHVRWACTHAGRYVRSAPPLNVKAADLTVSHLAVTNTTCQNPTCGQFNCADPNDPSSLSCQGRTPAQNKISIPPTASNNSTEFETALVGNLTSKIPPNLSGCTVDPNINYAGQHKAQEAVIEPKPRPIIDSKDFKVDPQSTNFVQDPQRHKIIDAATQ